MTSAQAAYAVARNAVNDGDLSAAESQLRLAASLDPGMAIYHRQLGSLLLLQGDVPAALASLETAVAINPADDLGWRTLGIAYEGSGDMDRSSTALDQATALQRSDVTNLLLVARDRLLASDASGARSLLAEVLQAWPEIAATPEWAEFSSDVAPVDELITAALDRWAGGAPSPEPLIAQRLLLEALVGSEAGGGVRWSRLSGSLATAYSAVMGCEPTGRAALESTAPNDKRQVPYWLLAVRQANIDGTSDGPPRRAFLLMTGDTLLQVRAFGPLNPLNENGRSGSSYDRWGYRRAPIDWPTTSLAVPAPRSGMARLILEPTEAAQIVSGGQRSC
jgi:tetratricopeptide (TPR) repeat protein